MRQISWYLVVGDGKLRRHSSPPFPFSSWCRFAMVSDHCNKLVWCLSSSLARRRTSRSRSPESPRWLLKKGKFAKAYESLHHTRQTPLQACRDLYHMHAHMQSETRYFMRNASGGQTRSAQPAEGVVDSDEFQDQVSHSSYTRRFLQLFTQPRIRRATTAACIVMIAQQLCGVSASFRQMIPLAHFSRVIDKHSGIFIINGCGGRYQIWKSCIECRKIDRRRVERRRLSSSLGELRNCGNKFSVSLGHVNRQRTTEIY